MYQMYPLIQTNPLEIIKGCSLQVISHAFRIEFLLLGRHTRHRSHFSILVFKVKPCQQCQAQILSFSWHENAYHLSLCSLYQNVTKVSFYNLLTAGYFVDVLIDLARSCDAPHPNLRLNST